MLLLFRALRFILVYNNSYAYRYAYHYAYQK